MKLNYDFDKLLNLPAEEPATTTTTTATTTSERPHLRIVKCCSNCKYAWFGHSNERRGYCRIGNYDKSAPNRDTPHSSWRQHKTHSTLICDNHTLKAKAFWNECVSKWIEKVFDINGEMVE